MGWIDLASDPKPDIARSLSLLIQLLLSKAVFRDYELLTGILEVFRIKYYLTKVPHRTFSDLLQAFISF